MLSELWKDALVALLVIAGYQWAGRRPTAARRAARAAAAISATVLASVILSGAWRPSPDVVAYHRGASHGLVILDWLFVFAVIGVAARLSFTRRPWHAVGKILVLVLVLCFTFL